MRKYFGFWYGLIAIAAQRYCVDVRGLVYSGKVSLTQQNVPCQRWDSQHPHVHGFTDASNFPDTTLADAANYCRAPDGNGKPWCYTTSAEQRWDHCDFDTIYWGYVQQEIEHYESIRISKFYFISSSVFNCFIFTFYPSNPYDDWTYITKLTVVLIIW